MPESHLLRDDHTHTIYSGHSPPDSLVSDMIRAAAERGLKHLVVLEHLPIQPRGITLREWRAARDDREHLDIIAEEVNWSRDRHPELEVLLGVELDADPWALDGSLMLADLTGLDVVVAATHVFPGGEAFWFEDIRVVDEDARRELVRQWFAWVTKVAASGQVDALAHPGSLIAVRRLIDSFDEPDVLAGFAHLADAMAAAGVAFELNEALYYKLPPACRDTYPLVLRTVHERGVRFTLGTDSHSMGSIGQYSWTVELMRAAEIAPDRLAPLKRGKRGEVVSP